MYFQCNLLVLTVNTSQPTYLNRKLMCPQQKASSVRQQKLEADVLMEERNQHKKGTHPATDWACFTSFHPLVYTTHVEMMSALQRSPRIFISVLCKQMQQY